MFRYLKNNFIAIDNNFKCTVAEFLQLEPNANFDGIDEIYYSNDKKYQIVNGNQTGYYNTNINTYIANKQDYIDTLAEWNAPTPPTLEEVKQSKIQEIKAECVNRVFQPVAYKDTFFKATQIASNNIMGALLLKYDNVEWLDTQENTIMLTNAELEELGNVISQQYNIIYKQESRFIQQINNANSVDEVNQIVWG
jgi:hypothetical protein